MSQRLLSLLFLCCCSALVGQDFVFPGDANNNGRVDHFDVLPIGFAFGSLGPTRPAPVPDEPQEILAHWPAAFPGGLNYIHADANANGMVELLDFVLLTQNLDLALPEVEELEFLAVPTGAAAALTINGGESLDPTHGGVPYSLPLRWEELDADATVNGIALTLTYNPAYVSELEFSFAAGWINEENRSFRLLHHDPGEIRIAVTRFGADPVEGSGLIGTLNFVVIEDLVGLLPNDSSAEYPFLEISGAQAFDGNFHPLPLTTNGAGFDGTDLSPVGTNDLARDALGALAFPNPASEELTLQTTEAFTQIEVITTSGRRLLLFRGEARRSWEQRIADWPPGLYYLRLSGPRGQSLLPILKSSPGDWADNNPSSKVNFC